MSLSRFTLDLHALAQAVFADELGRDKGVVRRLIVTAISLAEEAVALRREFENAVGWLGWAQRTFRRPLGTLLFARLRIALLITLLIPLPLLITISTVTIAVAPAVSPMPALASAVSSTVALVAKTLLRVAWLTLLW